MNREYKVFTVICVLVFVASCDHLSGAQAAPVQSGDEYTQRVTSECESFDSSIKTLDDYAKFHANYDKLNKCIHDRLLAQSPNKLCLRAEEACQRNGLLYSNVDALARLNQRFQEGEPVCTIEFSSKLYHLHNRLQEIYFNTENGAEIRLLRILRILANKVALKCRQSLAARLVDVEKRAPDAIKYIALLNGMLSGGKTSDGNAQEIDVEPEHYVPILEYEQTRAATESIGQSVSGHEFKLTQPVRVSLESAKMSCSALKTYHVNLLGSLGLLASIGYGAPMSSETKVEDSIGQWRVRRWTLTAILCQSLRGVVRMGGSNVEGKALSRFKVLPSQESDLTVEQEADTTFATFKLSEQTKEAKYVADEDAGKFHYKDVAQINTRKAHLLYGPNYKLANAIYEYLDLSQKNRHHIPFDILNIAEPASNNADVQDEDEDEG